MTFPPRSRSSFEVKKIDSAQNSHFKIWKKLLESRGLRKEGLFILSGSKLIQEVMTRPIAPPQPQIHGPTMAPVSLNHLVCELITESMNPLSPDSVPKYLLSETLFRELDVLGTHFNLWILALPTLPPWRDVTTHGGNLQIPSASSPRILELAIPLGDPGNLGTLIRSAVGFGVTRILLTQESCHPFLPKALKAAAGSTLCAPLCQAPDLKTLFHWPDLNSLHLDLQGAPLTQFSWPQKSLLILGEEGPGISKDWQNPKSEKLSIQTTNKIESLNAAIAGSIACYEWARNA